MNYTLQQIGTGPCPVFFVAEEGVERSQFDLRGPTEGNELEALFINSMVSGIFPKVYCGCCRAVKFERLPFILANGCDVEPTSAPMYVGDLGKAAEYGGREMVIQFFDPRKLDRTYREVEVSMPTEELDELKKNFPSVLTSEDGKMLWLSRLSLKSTGIASAYEADYARWIPGDPFEAIKMIWVLAPCTAEIIQATLMAVAASGRFRIEDSLMERIPKASD